MTEGEFDALLLWQHGIPAFSLTNGDKSWRKLNWIAPLERVQRLILCRDQDVAGKTATEGLIDAVHEALPTLIIHPLGWNCQGKDVTELWQLNPRGFALLVERLHTIMELP
jgi:DNA primase